MSFVLDHFEDVTKWTELISGSGSVSEKTVDSFKATCPANLDIAGLVTVNQHDLTSCDIKFYVDRQTVRSMIILRQEKELINPQTPATGQYLYAFIRDGTYGVQVTDGYGFLYMQPDTVAPEEFAEMRIVISEGVIHFYYEGVEIHTETLKRGLDAPLHVYLLAYATTGAVTITGTTSFLSVPTAVPLTINVSPSEPQSISTVESVLFNAVVSGGLPPYVIDWYVNDEKIASGTDFVFTSLIEGIYDVYAIVTDSENITAQSNITTVTISEAPIPPPPGIAETKSEIRGITVHYASMSSSMDWNLIAQTCKGYSIQAIYEEVGGISIPGNYTSAYFTSNHGDQLAPAIAACHAIGLKLHISFNVLASPKPAQSEYYCIDHNGAPYAWACPTKQVTRDYLKLRIEELVTNYDIDGFMFDYIRYPDYTAVCYCPECKAKFEEYLGETIPDSNWAPNQGDFSPTGSRYQEFQEWRNIPINELVRDMRNWMLTIKPNLEFSLAAWTYFEDCPIYWRKFLGQDTGDWIKNGYLDMVAPMMYTADASALADMAQTNLKYMVGGAEGKILLCGFIDAGRKVLMPTEFKAIVDKCREVGLDGWIIWRYGGPGVAVPTHDIRDFLSVIDLPPVFTLGNIRVSALETQATISWDTNLAATSKVEYSTTPLFPAFWREWQGFPYWDIDHVPGVLAEDNTPVTQHNITLAGLAQGATYYFRVQSQNGSGIATSKVYTFKTIGITVSITGTIIDAKTSVPIAGATVKAASYAATSEEDGTFNLEVAPGTYTVTVEKQGYETLTIPDVDATTDIVFPEAILLSASPSPINLLAPIGLGLLAAYFIIS